jgi:hypothetical protein
MDLDGAGALLGPRRGRSGYTKAARSRGLDRRDLRGPDRQCNRRQHLDFRSDDLTRDCPVQLCRLNQ